MVYLSSAEVKSAISPKSYPVKLPPGTALQVDWTDPRDVWAFQLAFSGEIPHADEVTIEWWRRIWPDNGTGGWMKLDDPFNGRWVKIRTAPTRLGPSQVRFDVAPLDEREAPGSKRTGLPFRHTYKVRLSFAKPVILEKVELFSDAIEEEARLRFQWDVNTTVTGRWSPHFEARNGRVLKTAPAGKAAAIVEVSYCRSTNRLSADRGMVICRSGELRSFSVFVDDVLREGGIYIRDIGAFVSDADRHLAYATWPGAPGEVWKEGTIAEQVAQMPEQNFAQAMKAIPLKPANYLFLGVPNLRQEIALGPHGDVRLLADSLRSPGPDAERRPWKWKELTYHFGAGEKPSLGSQDQRTITRSLEEGWLPVARHQWGTDGITYAQSCVASTLVGEIEQLQTRTGTEPVVLSTRFEIRNTAAEPRVAYLWLALSHPLPWKLDADGTLVLQAPSEGAVSPGLTPVRGRFNTFGRGQLEMVPRVSSGPSRQDRDLKDPAAPGDAVRYRVQLGPNESHAVELAVPYIELLDARELAALKSISYAAAHASVVKFWKSRIAQGMTCEVPDKFLNELFKANLWHVLISTDLDPVTGRSQHGAATHQYLNFLNETAMVARSLEMRGEHQEALRLIEPFLASQGVKGLPGNFKSKEGVFYAAHSGLPDPYTAQGYNMHHGWGMWVAAEHFAWTRDQAYLRRIADKLVKASDWITRERRATQFKSPDGSRPVEYGLAPAGDLEDVEEYLYFYATDAYYYLGMKQAAQALASIGHPQARRLARETRKFLEDLRTSVGESVATSPAVRLKDGSYVPFVPPRVYAITHQKEGWIREALYPALHLCNAGVYPENHPFVEWMIQDLEDNIFLSKESGYGVEDQKANFFNLGGFTLQPNLLDLPIIYLKRDQVPNFLRGFYNTGWASLYPDTMCFAEWVPSYGQGGGPLYKTPDECKFIQWMRSMLVLERGQDLELGLGVPRAWMRDGQRVKIERAATLFGPLDMEIYSRVAAGEIRATVKLAKTEGPKAVLLRLRHPAGTAIRTATVNGHRAVVNTQRQLIQLEPKAASWEIVAKF